jgi:hypothetical protein
VPEGWVLLPPGDPALTRQVKAVGDNLASTLSRATHPGDQVSHVRLHLAAREADPLPLAGQHPLERVAGQPHY